MNEEQTIVAEKNPDNSFKMLKAMVGIGLLCALFIVMTYQTTLPRIKRNKAAALEKAIFRVVPGMDKKKSFTWSENDGFTFMNEANQNGDIVYVGYNEAGELAGIAIEASGQGYADIIKILYGYDPENEQIIGFYVLESKETPGLGDKIEKDENFLANFDGLDVSYSAQNNALNNEIVTVKNGAKSNQWEIDGITGATISSRAIGDILNKSSQEWVPRISSRLEQLKKFE